MATKEDAVRLANKLMSNQKDIRNIGIVAHIDHGKCISPDARIFLADGSIVTAEELFARASLNGEKVAEDGEKEVYALGEEVKTFSVDRETGEIISKIISHAWRLKGGKVLKLTLENGFEIKTTPEHKYLVFDGVEFNDVEAKNISKGQRIVSARRIETETNINLKSEIITLLSEKDFYVMLEKEFHGKIFVEMTKQGIRNVIRERHIKTNEKSFRDGFKKKRIKLSDLLLISSAMQIKKEKLYDSIECIYLKDSTKLKLPQEFRNLYYLAGLLAGDGSGNKFIVGKNELGEKFRRICLELGFEPNERDYGYRTRELATNNTLQTIIECLFDYPRKNKSHNITISQFLKRSPDFLLAEFLKGYFDTDGTVEKSRKAISVNSVSRRMLDDLMVVLPRFGCVPILNKKKNTIYLSGCSAASFMERIGFGLESKQLRAKEIIKNITGSQINDLVPVSGLEKLRNDSELAKNDLGHHYYKYENNIYTPTINTYLRTMQKLKMKQEVAAKKIDSLAFIGVKSIEESHEKEVFDFTVPETHNFLAEGIFIHNTTMTDSLVAAAGLISEELAGKQRFMDYYALEQERGITINAANISLAYKQDGKDYLINVIDTPGHIDFGGDVIRAMRAVDGVILVVDSVEGVMPQTETVLRQALREHVRPVLFINKVDRLVTELKVTEEQMKERFLKTIAGVNKLIKNNAPKEMGDKWLVKVEDGSVAFGSGYHKWAVSVSRIKKTGIGFKEVFEYCRDGRQKELSAKSPLHEGILEMAITHLPSPVLAQSYRMKSLWKGDLDSQIGKDMIACNPNGAFTMMVTDVMTDPHAGDIATGRVYSGTIKKGTKVRAIGLQKEVNIQQVAVYMGPDKIPVDEIPAGNIAAIVGLKEVYAGETIASEEIIPFEAFKTNSEPVITMSVEAKSTKDLPKLIEVLKKIMKEDPNVVATINQETGEHLISGMGELHLEVTQYRIETDNKVPIQVSPPIVVYKETILGESGIVESKSPNRHNKFKMQAKPIPPEILEKLIESKINAKIRIKDKVLVDRLRDEVGFEREFAKKIWCVHNNNVLVDLTRGIQALHEIKELVIQGFEDAMNSGPLAKERVTGIMIALEDATLHEDAIHRGPAQVLPAVTKGIYATMLYADPIMLEPKQTLTITVPEDAMGSVSRELGSRRTQITEIRQEGDSSIIVGKSPVKELIGFSQAIRSATQGRAVWTGEYAGYEPLPRELQAKTISEVRKRKGLDEKPRNPESFLE